MRRREAILGTGLLLAAIAEIQWATASLGTLDYVEAVCVFAAGAGLLLVSGGMFFGEGRSWTLLVGLAVAAAAHVAYLAVSSGDFGYGLITVAAGLAAIGLVIGAWAARGTANVQLLRIGFAVAALGGLTWTIADLMESSFAFMVGNIFSTVGFATAAWFTADEAVA